MEGNYNPAMWMLEVTRPGVGNDNGDMTDFITVCKESRHFEELGAGMTSEGVLRPLPSVPALAYDVKCAATKLARAMFLMRRFFLIYWRTASYNLTRFFISVVLGLLFGLTHYSIHTYKDVWYFVASTIVETPYVFVSALLFVTIIFPMVEFTGFVTFLTYWLYLSWHSLWHAYVGYIMSYVMPTVDVATIFGVLIISIFLLFSGFNPPCDSIPQGYKSIYDIDPMKYSLAILTAIGFGDCSTDRSGAGCNTLSGDPPTCFAIKHSELHKNVAFMVIFIILYRILVLLALRFINHMKR
ncbi:Pleiotropic drug resistance protein transporter [Phytophthora megakarya]|uniref:Pleiotropic drug resistance protein transporter n=1 Tax=Phytophthora megakarya TaxID=4795 RepID=A0A225WRW1_9STRA|nr:Pleiotropic drug resistance protein transporter [Phytophthora megakarya]